MPFFAKKSLGQNFLMHARIAERIVMEAKVPAGQLVLEIGPGTGMLTKALLAAGYPVLAVEADSSLIPGLGERFAAELGEERLTLVSQDIRRFSASSIDGDYALVANIPYYLTGEILRKFLTETHKPTSLTVLVQKEVASRIARDAKESLLSLSVKAYGTPEYCFTVPRGAFMPAPNVDSAVLAVRDIARGAFPSPRDEEAFFKALHAGFAHKRKQLGRNLGEVFGTDAALKALAAAAILPSARAEDIMLPAWRALARALSD